MPELCTEPLKLDCPGDAPPCQGFCMLRVCARYDTIAGSADIQNLTVAFVGRRTAPPVTTAELEETSASECYWNFNAGRGYVEYVDANGNRNRLDRDEMDKALDRIPGSPDPSIWAERQRIIDKGHCTDWTPQERAWMLANGYPTQLGGWTLEWGCQRTERGSGMSVRGLKASHTGPIRSFELAFDIDTTCLCMRSGAQTTGVLIVRLKYP